MESKKSFSVSAYTARMPTSVRNVLKELAHISEISMNRITYDCMRSQLKAWAAKELSGELVIDEVTHQMHTVKISESRKTEILQAIDQALLDGDEYWKSIEGTTEDS